MRLEDSISTKTRRQYMDEFKTEAVRLVRDSARPCRAMARDLGIAGHLLYRWRVEQQQAESEGHTRQSMCAEQEELARLRRENAILKQERDCLRRAARPTNSTYGARALGKGQVYLIRTKLGSQVLDIMLKSLLSPEWRNRQTQGT